MKHRSFWIIVLVIIGIALATRPPGKGSAQTSQRCFIETSFCITGRIREYWEQNGGLEVFGFPISPQHEEIIEAKPLQAQWFERNRFELHPENRPPYDVLLGRLGVVRLSGQDRDWQSFPQSSPRPGCRFFPETSHNVCGDILVAWHRNGLEFDGHVGKSEAENLALFGLPISDAQIETLSNDKAYTVQWFERARFEIHLENDPPYNVLLGLLGNEVSLNSVATPMPIPTGTSTITPEPTKKPKPRPKPKQPPYPAPVTPTKEPTRMPPYP